MGLFSAHYTLIYQQENIAKHFLALIWLPSSQYTLCREKGFWHASQELSKSPLNELHIYWKKKVYKSINKTGCFYELEDKLENMHI